MMNGWLRRALLWLAVLMPLAGWAESAGAVWPRQFVNVDGSITVIPEAPQRILSTSVTVTGTLLAIDAPLVASATTSNGEFFAQWQPVARQRGVEPLWPAGAVDLESAYAIAPDLIVVSSGGADSALAQRQLLATIAPTIVVDYGGQTWQALATQLGRATGLEQRVAARLAAYESFVSRSRARLRPPSGLVNIISYNGAGAPNPIATADGVHGLLLQSLGFQVEAPLPHWQIDTSPTNDFVRASFEHLLELRAPTTFLLSADDGRAGAFLSDPLLVNLPSVRSGQVYGLGANSFRIDFYSASEIIEAMLQRFPAAAGQD